MKMMRVLPFVLLAILLGAAASQPTTAASSFAAISYFQDHCANCHGEYGAMLSEHQTTLPPDLMRQRVAEMARGPGMAPLEDQTHIDAVAAFITSIGKAEPYATLTKVNDNTLEGEAAPGTTVIIETPGQRSAAKVEGHTWRAATTQPWTRILATKDKAETTIAARRVGQ